ncbi:MAG TPA: aldo/keto reductase [Chloroflexota bacterium]|nr:aldo/keto reductase [Chloroflexota bacterium]
MKYRTLGKTGLQVSEIGLGMWAIGGDAWGPVDDEESLAAIRRAWDLGVNFFDTSDQYGFGHSEEVLGRFLAGVPRDQIIVASKVGLFRGEDQSVPNPYSSVDLVVHDCEQSLKRLGTDHIDVYQDHLWWDENVEIFAEAFLRLRDAGKVRFLGVSTNDMSYIEHFDRAVGGMDTLQIDYSILNRQPEQDTLPYCQERNIGVIARGSLGMGKLTGKFTPDTTFPESDWRRSWVEGDERAEFLRDIHMANELRSVQNGRTLAQLALGYVLANPAVSLTIPGAKNPRQVEQNVAAVEHPLSAEEVARIREIAEQGQPAHP